jgi:Ca2+:H+ antiporter
MEITIGVAVGSSIQIAAGMIPLLVLIAWPMGKDLTLFFVSFLATHLGRMQRVLPRAR